MSDTVTQALRRIAAAEGATYSLSDTDVILARRIYEVLSGSNLPRATFGEAARKIAEQVGATVSPATRPVESFRKAVVARGGSTTSSTLLGVLQDLESVGLS